MGAMFSTAFAWVIAVSSLTAAGWVGYFRWKDRAQPEPLWLMIAMVGGGMAAVALAAVGYGQLERWGFEVLWQSLEDEWPKALGAALTIGFIEELAKAVPVIAIALWSRYFDEWLDGAIYAGCAGIGFAVAETALHAAGGFTVLELWPRILAAPMSHALFAAPFGLGVGALVLAKKPGWAVLGAAASVVAHGGYDLALARAGAHGVVSAGIVLLLWVGFILAVPRVAAQPTVARAP